MKLTLEQVYELMDKLVSTGLGEVEIEAEGVKVKLKAKEPKQQVVQAVSAPHGGGGPGSGGCGSFRRKRTEREDHQKPDRRYLLPGVRAGQRAVCPGWRHCAQRRRCLYH